MFYGSSVSIVVAPIIRQIHGLLEDVKPEGYEKASVLYGPVFDRKQCIYTRISRTNHLIFLLTQVRQ